MADQHETTTGVTGGSQGKGEKVKEAAHQAKEKASDVAASAREKGEDLAEQGKEKAEELAHRAGDMARSRADEEKERVAGGLRTVADALRRGSEDLPEDRRMYGRFVEAVADRADGVSRYLQDRDVDDLSRDVKRFAREHTPVFLSGAFALGMMGARFLKSSGDAAREERYPVSEGYPTAGGYSGGYASARGYVGPVRAEGSEPGAGGPGGSWDSADYPGASPAMGDPEQGGEGLGETGYGASGTGPSGRSGPEMGSIDRTGGENA